MLDFDYMAPEIIVNAVRLISGGEPIKVRGVVYVPELTCDGCANEDEKKYWPEVCEGCCRAGHDYYEPKVVIE